MYEVQYKNRGSNMQKNKKINNYGFVRGSYLFVWYGNPYVIESFQRTSFDEDIYYFLSFT